MGKAECEDRVLLRPGVPEYFFDDSLISYQHKLTRTWLPATVFPEPAIRPEKPWESRMAVLYGTVIERPGGGYRIYYTTCAPGQNWVAPERNWVILAAESEDGFHWTKPELGINDWRGSSANNISLIPEYANDSPSVICDPDDHQHPYKLVLFEKGNRETKWGPGWGIHGYGSSDGLRWRKLEPVPLVVAGDRTNAVARKVGGNYVIYTRHKLMFQQNGVRAVYRSESPDFASWSEPELVLAPDLEDAPDVEYYGMSVFQRHGWHIGLLEYWRETVDTIETYLVFSRDGKRWQHPSPRRPFIASTYDWNRTWTTCASNGPIIIGDVMVFYFGGRWTSHHYDAAQQLGAIGYASLPIDRFCALEGTSGGRMVTVPIEWPGGELALNADTRQSYNSHSANANGEIAVEILDADGSALPDWSGENRAVFRGNTHAFGGIHNQTVEWPEARRLDSLRGTTIRFAFELRHARLFTICAQE